VRGTHPAPHNQVVMRGLGGGLVWGIVPWDEAYINQAVDVGRLTLSLYNQVVVEA